MKHVFISYVRQNEKQVDRLATFLRISGVKVWLDKSDIKPGTKWKMAIREAISSGAFFIACFSYEYNKRTKNYMNEELNLAIEQIRLKANSKIWFIPIRLSNCKIPSIEIRTGLYLSDLQWIDIFLDWDEGLRRLLKVMNLTIKTNDDNRKLSGSYPTLFKERLQYYNTEKNFLAEQFSRLLLSRLKSIYTNQNRPITVFIDSGTTLYYLLGELGSLINATYKDENSWVCNGNLSIVTNNILAMFLFIEHATTDGLSPTSEAVVPCTILPGIPQGNYGAITGDETIHALSQLGLTGNIVITVISANFVKLSQTFPSFPVPLVRGSQHPPIKKAAIKIADEAYFISPLGKILPFENPETLNEILHEYDNEYVELSNSNLCENLCLVTTRRYQKDILFGLSKHLLNKLEMPTQFLPEKWIQRPLGKPDHVLFPFDKYEETPLSNFPFSPSKEFIKLLTEFPYLRME